MGYGYAETFLVIFLTHPGVIIPTASTAVAKVSSMLPEGVGDAIPKMGASTTLSGLWQVFWAWTLSKPGEKSAAFGWTMYAIYLIFLLLYIYMPARMRFSAGL